MDAVVGQDSDCSLFIHITLAVELLPLLSFPCVCVCVRGSVDDGGGRRALLPLSLSPPAASP